MSLQTVETNSFTANPLDLLEEIVGFNDWAFQRASAEELFAEVPGRWCNYRLFFYWQEEASALQFHCQFDMKVPANRYHDVCELMAIINERMWLGHIDVDRDEMMPMFRHTTLLRGAQGASVEQMEDLMDIAITECERFYPAFQFCIWGGHSAAASVEAAILDTVAEA